MFEAVEVIHKLFAGSIAGRDTKHSGQFFTLESTRLWTMPETAPEILVATSGPVTAKRAGRTVDGLIVDGAPYDRIPTLFARFAEGAREATRGQGPAGRDPGARNPDARDPHARDPHARDPHVRGTRVLRLHLSWAATMEEAMTNAMTQWPNGALRFPRSDIRSPFEFEQLARLVRPEDFEGRMVVSEDPDVHRAEIQRYLDLGFDRVYLHNVGRNQREWIDVFGRDVLPKLVS
jgi:alkanesulfonate monooxygenase SsuD/methylene tetrahydromethanopterin reductase-like flavin-dependent oxidoreductase (luciferase family)